MKLCKYNGKQKNQMSELYQAEAILKVCVAFQ